MREDNVSADRVVDGEGLWDGRLLCFAALESTNTWVLRHADSCRPGDVVWAARQTAGRGRFSRAWLSPGDSCLTFSVRLQTGALGAAAACPGQIAAVAVRELLAGRGLDAALKWPNDVMAGGAKIAGVLCEALPDRDVTVIGIGLNVNVPAAELRRAVGRRSVTSMRATAGRRFDIGELRRALCAGVERRLDQVRRHGPASLWRYWSEHDWLAGREIVVTAAACRRGRYDGLDEAGRLRLVGRDGAVRVFWTGDVERVRTVAD